MMDVEHNFAEMIEEKVPGDQRRVVVGCEKELEKHFEKIRSEFYGMPVLCFHLAKIIVQIRRRTDLEKDVEEFFAIVNDHIDLVCSHYSTRWLVAVCDTIVDHGSPLQGASALSIVVLVNSIKLSESERQLQSRVAAVADQDLYFEHWPHELWDDVTSYQVLRGDMPRNMFLRIEASLVHTPVVARIFEQVKLRLMESDNLFSRLAPLNQTGFWTKSEAPP